MIRDGGAVHNLWRLTCLMLIAGTLLVVPLSAAFSQVVDANALSGAGPTEVDIEADQLQVIDEEKRAVFSGNVQATRSDVRLNSNRLEVRYGNAVRSDGSKKTEITNLDATGNVVIVTSKQRIVGEWAKMDVRANQVTVGGNVTVQQGKTVLRGNQLFVDLNTNQSTLSGGRVKGNFLPGN